MPVPAEGQVVNKSQLIDALSERFEGNRKQAQHALDSVLDTITRQVAKGEKVAIIGPSGVGKTTFIRLLVGELKPVEGEIKWGHEAVFSYFPQDHDDLIPKDTTCVGYLQQVDPKAGNEVWRGLLGRMLFSGEEGTKPTKALSGGEKVRLLLARFMLEQNNVLILDEPTAHLDLESISALTDGMKSYPGTLLFVSHDRNMVSDVATRIISMRPDGNQVEVIDFNGTYEEYLAKYPPPIPGKKAG